MLLVMWLGWQVEGSKYWQQSVGFPLRSVLIFPLHIVNMKILLLLETQRKFIWELRPIGDLSETDMSDQRPSGDLDMLHLRLTCLIEDLNMLHRRSIRDLVLLHWRPTCLIGDPSKTSTCYIGDQHAWSETHQRPGHATSETDMPDGRPLVISPALW